MELQNKQDTFSDLNTLLDNLQAENTIEDIEKNANLMYKSNEPRELELNTLFSQRKEYLIH